MNDPRSSEALSNRTAGRRSPLGWLLDLLLPRHCVLCGQTHDEAFLCTGCRGDLPEWRPCCPVCAIETPDGQVCGRCLRRPPFFDRTLAAYQYAMPLDQLIQRLKYAHDLSVARALGEIIADRGEGVGFDAIVPVPLHRARLAERGFNQSVELARTLSRRSGIPLLLDGVRRTRQTPAQAGLSLLARRRNLKGAFQAMHRFDGQRVLVIDDVMTSGATLDAMARCLKRAGASEVVNLVCARTPAQR
jgi:ComF family protein